MDRLAAMAALVRVVETGSFSAAARQLGVGQPAVSKTVAQLEERLGVRLLLRSTRGLAPTEAGQNFYERAKRALEEADEADSAARGAGAGLTGRLRFSAPVTFARLQIVPRLPLFMAEHPALSVEAILDDRNVDLIEEGIDVAFRIGSVLADAAMTARRIAQSRVLVLGTPAYFEAAGEPRTPGALRDHAAVIYAQAGVGGTFTFRKGAATETVALNDRIRFTAAEGVREAVFAGLGLCVTTEWMFQPELDSGRVRPVLTDWDLPAANLWAAFPTGRRASAKARAFATFVEAQFRQSRFAPHQGR
ncbi:MAG: LysR family transcriptional regulator [Candidatus Eiseniibacteriota bacterium]